LAGDISSAANSLNAQSAALDQDASGIASQVNSLTGAIAQLNLEIRVHFADADAGTLEDQRQQDLSQLSQLIGINQVTTENNGFRSRQPRGSCWSQRAELPVDHGNREWRYRFLSWRDGYHLAAGSGGGQLGGILTARDVDIPGALNSLDQLAYSISTR
jgi:flagellar hook-associated protein 1